MDWTLILWILVFPLLLPPICDGSLESDRQQLVNETISAAKDSLENNKTQSALKEIEGLVGTHLNKTADRDSIFFKYRYCFHINIAGNSDWLEGYQYNDMIAKNQRFIRRLHDKIQDVRDLIQDCQAAWDEGKRTELTLPTNETINRCADKKEELLGYINSTKYEQDVKFALLDALNIIISTFIISFHYDFHNGERIRQLPPSELDFQLNLAAFPKMLQDIELRHWDLDFMLNLTDRNIANPSIIPASGYWKAVWKLVFINKMATPQYRDLFLPFNPDVLNNTRVAVNILKNQIRQDFMEDSNWETKYNQWRADYSTFSQKEFDNFKTNAENLFDKNFRADLLNPEDPPHLYEWRRNNNNKAIFDMLLSWDRVDEVLEQLRCFHFISYEHLRPETLKRAQRDLKTAKLFNGSSTTLGQPCANLIYADNATTGTWFYSLTSPQCTLENNEICAPRPLSQFEEPDDPLRGGISVLKPKWVFRTDAAHGECIGHRIWVIQQFACRCGFRTDCGADLETKISCPLQPKDWEDRRQCLGSVGYPCKTLPLAPGKINESCVTEYCDMEENSCEDRPSFLRRRSGAMASPYGSLALAYPFWMMNLMILMIAF